MAGTDVFHLTVRIEPSIMYLTLVVSESLANILRVLADVREHPPSLSSFVDGHF